MDRHFSRNRSYPYRGSVGRYHGIPYTTRENVVVIGPLETTAEVRKTIPLSPVWGGLILAAGIVLVIIGVKRP